MKDWRAGFHHRVPWLVFFLGLALLMPSVWSETSITGKDEYWLSFRTPMEMLARDSWLTPFVNGEPRLKKPPLLYWGILLNYKLFGIHPLSARIWGVLAGASAALCATLLSRRLFHRSGLTAGLIALSTMAVAVEGRRAMLDLPLAALVAFAVYFALCWGQTGRWMYILASALVLALSTMVKGPVGVMFFGAAALTALWLFGRWRWALDRWPQLLTAACLFLLVSLPWPMAMLSMWPDFLKTVGAEIGSERIGRFSVESPFSALGGALGLVFPWSIAALFGIVAGLRGKARDTFPRRRWLAAWCIAGVLPFFFARSFARYMIPLIPPICVLSAEWLLTARTNRRHRVLRVTAAAMGVAAVPWIAFVTWFAPTAAFGFLSILLVAVMIWIAFRRGHAAGTAAAASALFACLIGGLYPSLGIGRMPCDLGDIVGDLPAAVYKTTQPSLLSMRLGRSVIQLWPETLQDAFHERRFNGVVFMEERESLGFEQAARRLNIRCRRMGTFDTLFSRRTWIRFAREGTTLGDWKRAFAVRSLEPLCTRIAYYRAFPGDAPDE